ncbi:hypothetical protein KR018_007616 [Drosophila ironensis]|nr:hypothetical protein KR018_007616 [Drosophila ironensis]
MLRLLPVVLCLGALSCLQMLEARQIRINRYAVSVQEDQPAVQPAKKAATPYPPSGYRPQGRSFLLPGEEEVQILDGASEGSGASDATTTQSPLEDLSTSTTETTTDFSTTTTNSWDSLDTTTTQAPPAVELRSGRAYEKAPYPPAGYRPSRAFRLPTEENPVEQQPSPERNATADSNADHPVCGVSTNPLKPTPEPGTKDEPDAESVVITGYLGPGVVVARAPSSIPVAIPLRSQRLIAVPLPPREFVYTTHVESLRKELVGSS